jgi:hypothetical protein
MIVGPDSLDELAMVYHTAEGASAWNGAGAVEGGLMPASAARLSEMLADDESRLATEAAAMSAPPSTAALDGDVREDEVREGEEEALEAEVVDVIARALR